MLIPLAFLLLLAHFPPLQGTTSMRKNSTGLNQPTPHTIALNIPKPITTFTKPKNQSPAIDTTSSKVNQTLTSTKPALVQKKPKDKPAPNPQPIKVIISEGCLQKEPVKAAVNSTKTQETELILKPGSPLVMTHRINLVPTACTGGCEAEMAALKGRVEFLEEQVSSLKTKCSACSGLKCPNDCSKQGKCEGGKCICQQGFIGIDCSTSTCPSNCNRKGKCVKGKCVCQPGYTGPDCSKGGDKRIKVTVETVTMKKVSSEAGTLKEGTSSGKKTKPDKTIFLKKKEDKDQKKDSTTKQTVKAESTKTSTKQGVKSTTVKVQSNDTRSGKVVKTIGQILLKHQGERRQEQATKGKTTIMKVSSEKITKPDVKKVGIKLESKRQSPKDQPAKENVTSNVLVSTAKGTSLNVTVSGTKVIKTAQTQGGNVTVKSTGRATSPTRNSTKLMGIGSVKVHNITSSGFILTWEAPQGTFKNFTVSRREFQKGSDEKEEEDIEEAAKIQDVEEKVTEKANVAWNVTEVQKQSSNRTLSSKPHSVSKGKGDSKSLKTFSQVLAGTARSFHFRNLRSLTRYSISLFGSSSGSRSKIHRLTISTGPEPPTELTFSNVTETSFSVSWTKPKSTVTGFRVTYTNSANGETGSMLVDSQRYHASLSKLLPGSTYDIKVSSLLETAESESVTATIVTVPDSPLNLQAINITDTKAVLTWKPAQAKVDRYILSYSSTKSPNVTVTVMVSGSAEEHHLRGLHKSTIYTVKAMSQVNSLQSSIVSTSFTTSSGVKLKTVTPAEVTYNSAVISWKAPKLTVKSYRLTYQLEGQMAKEVIISPTITRYELTELQVSSNYTVKVEGERDGQYIIISSTEFTTGKLPYPFPSDCSEVQLNGVQKSGETEVYPHGQDGEPFWVYCDMETDGGGWTVFQRRMNGKTDFYRGWKDYSKGFGHLSEEFWLGNDLLHSLTSLKPMSLRVDLRAGNDTAYSHYSNFSIDSEANNYTIELFGYSGTAGDSMRYHHGRPFSTRDKDPIPLSIHCAKAYMGGWWYKNCYKANLNGLYATFSENQGVVWIDWKGKDTSIPFTEMKLRPASLSQTTMG